MTLAPGMKLGPYEVLGPLGAGGMGEVYRARDTRLDRSVAVKVLPQHLSSSPEVRARFEREAKAISSLNHPHICTLYDVGREGTSDYIVMELVEGETLAHRLTKGPLPVADVLRLGAQIADALDRAHRAGIVHRDLKPGNIMLTRSGAKLLDFGLARAAASGQAADVTRSPTVAQPITAEGTIVGTVQYMAPEQLDGKDADARADVWALGCVLYEMSTGRPAFEGATQASLIGAILRDEPRAWPELQPLAPPGLERLVRACLEKDPSDRVQSAHDVKLQLGWLADGGSQTSLQAPGRSPRATLPRLSWILAIVLPVLAAAAAWLLAGRRPVPALPMRAMVLPPPGATFNLSGDTAGPPVLSPDGSMLAFAAISGSEGARIWVREVGSLTARSLPGTEGAQFPFWSPDGKSLGFFSATQLRRADLTGGPVVTLCAAPGSRGGTWGPAGILFTPGFQTDLFLVSENGGALRRITRRDSTRQTTHRWPQFLPDGRHFLYFAGNHQAPDREDNGMYFASLDGKENRQILHTRSSALFASGYLLSVRDSVLFAQRFDPDHGRLVGDPVPTQETVRVDPATWRTSVTASRNGVLAYQEGGTTGGDSRLQLVQRDGRVTRPFGPVGNIYNIDLSRDGRHAVLCMQIVPTGDLWIQDLERDTHRRLTFGPEDEDAPVFSTNGERVYFTSSSGNLHYRLSEVDADGSSPPRVLLQSAADVWPTDCSLDGRSLLVTTGDFRTDVLGRAIAVFALDGSARLDTLVSSRATVGSARFSPDGRWITFASTESGTAQVYLTAWEGRGRPRTSGRWQASLGGGNQPRWQADGRALYFVRQDGTVVSVDVDATGGTPRIGAEKPLFHITVRQLIESFEPLPDGSSFLVSTLAGDWSTPVVLVSDWLAQLRKR